MGGAKALVGAFVAFISCLQFLRGEEAKLTTPGAVESRFDILRSPGFRVSSGGLNEAIRKELFGTDPIISLQLKYAHPDPNPVRFQIYFGNSVGMMSPPEGVLRHANLDFLVRQSKKFTKATEIPAGMQIRDKIEQMLGGSGFKFPINSDWSSVRRPIDSRSVAGFRDGGSFAITLPKDQLKLAKVDPNSWFEIKDVYLSNNSIDLPPGAEGIRSRNLLDVIVDAQPVPSPDSTIINGAKEGIGAGLIVDLKKGGSIKAGELSIQIPATPVEGKLYGVAYLLVELTEQDPDFRNRLEKDLERGDLLTFLFEGAYGLRIEAVQGAPVSIRDVRNKVRVARVDYPQNVEGKPARGTIRRHVLPVQVPTGFELKSVTIAADRNTGSLAHLHHISFHTLEEAAALKLNDPGSCGQWTATDGIPPKH